MTHLCAFSAVHLHFMFGSRCCDKVDSRGTIQK